MRILTTISLFITTTTLVVWLVVDILNSAKEETLEYNEVKSNGQNLYSQAEVLATQSITLTNNNKTPHSFSFNNYKQWVSTEPYKDRADAIFHINPLIQFTIGAIIVDSIPINDIDLKDYGFDKDWIEVKFNDAKGENLVTYKIGMSSTWHQREIHEDEKGQRTAIDIPTVFVIKENAIDDKVLYLVSDPTEKIHNLFTNNFEGFRDHHPFALNLNFLEQVRIRRANSEILIDKSTPDNPWRISKPLDLATDKKSIRSFLINISKLTALKLHPIGSITLPEESKDKLIIGIKNRGIEEETILTIYPNDNNTNTAYATISDRLNVVFELPTQSAFTNQSSLASIPLSINEIRERNMLTLNRKNIAKVLLRPEFNQPILIGRPNQRNKYKLYKSDNSVHNINELNYINLLDAISVLPVKAFTSDAATDLTLYGFENPVLSIDIFPFAGPPQRLTFSRKDGKIYANRFRSSVVWEVDPLAFENIVTNEYEWKDSSIWLLLINDITSFSIKKSGQEKLTVNYDYLGDRFNATLGQDDVSKQISPIQAKFFLNNCHFINARKRLGPNNTLAQKALANPVLSATIYSAVYNDDGRMSDKKNKRTIQFAKPNVTVTNPLFYYAKVENEDDYLIVSPTIYKYFANDLFSDDE